MEVIVEWIVDKECGPPNSLDVGRLGSQVWCAMLVSSADCNTFCTETVDASHVGQVGERDFPPAWDFEGGFRFPLERKQQTFQTIAEKICFTMCDIMFVGI